MGSEDEIVLVLAFTCRFVEVCVIFLLPPGTKGLKTLFWPVRESN